MDWKLIVRATWTTAGAAAIWLSVSSLAAFAQGQPSSTPDRTAAPSPGGAAVRSNGLPQDVIDIANWLPEDTESIVFARGPLAKGVLRNFDAPPPATWMPAAATSQSQAAPTTSGSFVNRDAAAATSQPLVAPAKQVEDSVDFQGEVLGTALSLFGISGDAMIQNITDHEVRFVVAAARHFGPPVIGSASTYEGAEIIVFRDAVPDAGVQAKPQEHASMVQIERNGVVRLDSEQKWGEKGERVTVYYAKPKPSILIAATDARFLESILRRIAQPPESHTPVLDFPEWKYVDVQSPVWGVRHRRTATPIYILARSAKDGLPFAELSGISFSYQPKPGASVNYRFHFPERLQDTVRQVTAHSSGSKLVAPSIVENKVRIRAAATAGEAGESSPAEAAFAIQNLMGYVICP